MESKKLVLTGKDFSGMYIDEKNEKLSLCRNVTAVRPARPNRNVLSGGCFLKHPLFFYSRGGIIVSEI